MLAIRTPLWAVLTLIGMASATFAQDAGALGFTKAHSPSTIGSGSNATLVLTITNGTTDPATGIGFTDNLPVAVTIADNAISTTCANGVVIGAQGTGSLSLSDADLAPGASCTVTVNVTAATAGTHTNLTGTISSDTHGVDGTATADLTVTTALPNFSKSLAPSSINLGATSTLTYTVDNALNASDIPNLHFSETFPTGITVASPGNATTDCVSAGLNNTTITAAAGSSSITLDANGAAFAGFEVLGAGATCTVTVDVVGGALGSFNLASGELLADFVPAGTSSAALAVTAAAGAPIMYKDFTDDPASPGADTTLEFTILNRDRNYALTDLAFTDDLSAMLPASVLTGTVSNTCGATISGTSTITVSGGTLAVEAACIIAVSVSVPAGTAAGSYTNTSSTVSGTLNGGPVIGNVATANLVVASAVLPSFSKSFTDDPVAAGSDVTLEFTITNNDGAEELTDVTFLDELTTFMPFPVTAVVPAAPCGGTAALVFIDTDRQGIELSGGTIAAGETCTFAATITVPADMAGGSYTSTSGELSGTGNGHPVSGGTASDVLVINGGVNLGFTKIFDVASATSGGTANLTFTINSAFESTQTATDLAFSDALPGFPAGTLFTAISTNGCNGTETGIGTSTFGYSGGSIAPDASCDISVEVTFPAVLTAGDYTNTTTTLTGMAAGDPVGVAPAEAEIYLADFDKMTFTKAFIPDTLIAGQDGILRFTLDNTGANAVDATDGQFTDSLSAALAGLVAHTLPATPCGGTISGTNLLIASTLSVNAGTTCTFDVPVTIPVAASDGSYNNVTSDLFATYDGATSASSAPANAAFEVLSQPLTFSKSFIADPAAPGSTTALEFTLTNLAPSAATNVAFIDDLNAMLAGAQVESLSSNSCRGTAATPASTLSYSGGSIAANSSCTIVAEVSIPGGTGNGRYTNTTSALSGDVAGVAVLSDPATDSLTVSDVTPPTFTKSFDGAVADGGTATMTISITNNDPGAALSDLRFSDDLTSALAGLSATSLPSTPCGPSSSISGTTTLTFAEGYLAVGATCTFDIDLLVPAGTAAGSYDIPTSALTSGTDHIADPATASLEVLDANTGTITIVQNADIEAIYTYSSPESLLNFSIATTSGTGQYGPVRLTQGSYTLTQSRPDGSGNTSLTCNDADSTVNNVTGEITLQLSPLEDLICTYDSIATRQKTVDTINAFLARRADLILASEPSSARRIDRLRRGFGNSDAVSYSSGDLNAISPFKFDLTSIGSGTYNFSSSLHQVERALASSSLAFSDPSGTQFVNNRRWDVWTEISYQKFEADGTNSGHFGIAYVGADYLVRDDLLVGALIQIDDMEDNDSAANSSISGTGWMVSPYLAARLSEKLYFDGRIAYGQSDNSVSPFNTYSDDFDGERWLAQARLSGDFQRGDWNIQPNASLSYFQEMQSGYTDSLGVSIPSQTVSLGQFKFGPTVRGSFMSPHGLTYQPNFTFDAVYNFGQTRGVSTTNPDSPHTEGWRGRLKAGVNLLTRGGATVNLSAIYDGIGRSDFESWGLSLEINIPLAKPMAK